ncbi:MAG: hypothetical protein R3C03_14165 [Pirellulaceae bacterium]
MKSVLKTKATALALGGLFMMALAVNTGCQVSVGGQTLPSSYYQQDDIQFYTKGSKFKLPREAAALKAARQQDVNR